jgi:tetratricopeptide (TPR) repeat protein
VRQKAQAGNLTDALGRLDAARLDEELDRIVRTCLAQEQGDRFPNAGAVADAFAGYLASREERARAARVNAARAEARVVAERRVRKRTVVAAVSLVTAVLLIASGYFWMESHRRDRQRRADRNVVAALQSTTSAHEQALSAPPGDARRWAAVLVAANRVKALAEDDDVDPALRERAETLFSRVEKDAATAEEAATRAEKDRRMTARLDEIRTRVGDQYQFDDRKRDLDYAAAFKDYGIDVAALEDREVAGRIERSSIARHLVTALELWAYSRKQVHGRADPASRRLGRLAAELDPDPLRKRIRAAVSADDLETLQTIARSPEVMTLPVEDVERLARAMESAGDPTGAIALLRTAHARHPEDFWINYFLASWYRASRPPRLDDAACHASAAISIRPESASAWNLFGQVLIAAGRLDEAKTAFERALEIHPDFVYAVKNLGRVHCLSGKPERAIELYEREIKARPENAEMHFALGLACQDLGNLKRAMEVYRRALAISPALARARSNIGTLHVKLGQPEKAEAAFRQAIQTDPTLVEARVNLADLLFRMRRIEEAGELIVKAIEIDPHFGPAHNVHGRILARTGRRDEAIKAYREAIRLDPEESKHWNNLGVTYSVKGDLPAALQAFDTAIRLCPTNAQAHTNRGNILARMKRWPEARAAFRAALRHDPDNPGLLIKIGQVLEHLHRFEEALDHFRRGHALGSGRPGWKVDSGDLVKKCAWRIELLERMDAILEGEPEPTTGRELYHLANLASFVKRHAAAARFWRSGFKIAPRMARSANLFRAAQDAARAGSGQGADAGRLDAEARARWLRQGSVWLARYVEALANILETQGEAHRARVRASLLAVRDSPSLDGLRQTRHLAVLSRDDQLRCIALWAEVERLLTECED